MNSTDTMSQADMATMTATTESSNKVLLIIVTGITFGVINTFAIGARTYSQILAKRFNLNDVGMIFVLLTFGALVAFLMLGAQSGLGKHTPTVLASGVQNLSDSLKWIFFLEFFYLFLTTVMKASIAVTFLQWATTRAQKWVLCGAILANFTIGSVVGVFTVLQCTPISFSWLRFDASITGTCRDPNEIIKAGYALCMITVTLDMLFLIMPFIMMKHYQPNPRVKMYIYGLVSLGVQASIANFIRIAALAKLGTYKDPLFDAADVFLWSFIEVSLGITVAGLLELAPLMQRLRFKGFGDIDQQGAFAQFDRDSDVIRLVTVGKPKTFDA